MSDGTISDQAAISAALVGNWKDAIKINTTLLKGDKENISLLNRLGFAYLQSGQMTLAKKTFTKVLKLDPYNQIAEKNLRKLGSLRQKDILGASRKQGMPMSFLEEPGKTKIVECVNTAPFPILSCVSPGEEVDLKARNHVVEVRSLKNTYLGALPDDLSFRLIKFLAVGNTYQALVKSVNKNALVIFLRELTRGKRFSTQPSFASSAIYVPFTKTDRSDDSDQDSATKEKEGDE